MNERSMKVLEFPKIISLLIQKTETSLGAELAEELRPSTEIELIQELQDETDEAMTILRLNKSIPLGGVSDIRKSIKRSKIGGILNAQECLNIANTIYAARKLKLFIDNLEEKLPLLKSLIADIYSLRHVQDEISRCINDEAKIMDQASSSLRNIRSNIQRVERRIRERLDRSVRQKSQLLSDSIVTIRNNRYVLPVKSEHRLSFGGIVHDQSASGQTLFMEPKDLVQLNNELQASKVKEAQEIEKILKELSELIAGHHKELEQNIHILARTDFIYARAKLGQEMDGAKPLLNEKGIIKLRQARHPLIPKSEVVANDIDLGEDFTAILITGPNTGGKTVTLKMLGLCTMMAQSGLQVPALDGCEIAVFKEIFADIGDEQSIEQNLSTFSSHMTNIVSIMGEVTDRSLVLFDELGAGTDPQEGAALAMAILDDVVGKRARVLATTHYPELKAYAYNTKNVVNASVEFDIESLQPTYKLLTGIPGRSNAFDISKRLGLDEHIINRAKEEIGIDSANVENMIFSLEQSYKRANKAYEIAESVQSESEELLQDLQRTWEKFKEKREVLYKDAEEKAAKEIQRAKREAEKIVDEIKSMKNSLQFKEHKWIDARKQLEEAEVHLVEKGEEQLEEKTLASLEKDDEIILKSINQRGIVLEKISDNEYLVQVGVMRINVKRGDIKLVKAEESEPAFRPVVQRANVKVRLELDLRGERYEEAINKLDRYIDDALLANHPQVTIIHGKGTGALREGVHNYCKGHPRIQDYRSGGEKEGGSGVTVIKLT